MSEITFLTDDYKKPASISPRILFIDLDGTVVNSRGIIHKDCKQALQTARENGLQVAIATGRPYFAARSIIDELKISAPSLFFSGALVVNPQNSQILFEEGLSTDAVGSIQRVCQARDLYVEFYTRDHYWISRRNELTAIHLEYLKQEPRISEGGVPLESILKAVIVIDRSKNPSFVVETLSGEIPDVHFATGYGAAHPHIQFINVTSTRASRELCFEKFLEIFDVTANEVMAIGDAEADIPFLSLAGMGIAMGNAPESVKHAATVVTRHVDEQGLAYALERLLRY